MKSAEDKIEADSLESFKQALLSKRAKLKRVAGTEVHEALISDTPVGAGDITSVPVHPADQGTDMADQEKNLTLAERQENEILEIEDALNRIAAGSYGLCENCGQPILRERLKALPEARFCVDCEDETEVLGERYTRSRARPQRDRRMTR